MNAFKIVGALVVAGSLSACEAPLVAFVGPVEAIVAASAGYDSYYEKGLDKACEAIGGTLPRNPQNGNCE